MTLDKSKFWALACYIPPLFAPILLVRCKDTLAAFHARQAFAPWLVLALAVTLGLLPGSFFAVAKWPAVLGLGAYALFLLTHGVVMAARGETVPLPLIGQHIHALLGKK